MRWRRPRADSGVIPVQTRKIAFVMSGGGSLGAIQAGQLLAMFEAGITPDLVIGVSVGALNGAAIAHESTVAMAEQLSAIWRGLRRAEVFLGSRSERAWHLLRQHPHLYRPDGLVDLVTRFLPLDDLAQLSIPFEAVTVNIDEATIDFHSVGNPRAILVASASLPGVFPPVVINGSRHVDGGIAVNLPIQRARDLGATTIFAFDCRAGTKHRLPAELSALGVLTSSIAVAREILAPSRNDPDVIRLPAPDTHGIGLYDFSHSIRLMREGHDLVAAFLDLRPELRLFDRSAA
jgi:NTE family protein